MNKEEKRYIVKRMQQITDYFLDSIGEKDVLRGKKTDRWGSKNVRYTSVEMMNFKEWFLKEPRKVPSYGEMVIAIGNLGKYACSDPDMSDVFGEYKDYRQTVEDINKKREYEARKFVLDLLQEEQMRCDTVILGDGTQAAAALEGWNTRITQMIDEFAKRFLYE